MPPHVNQFWVGTGRVRLSCQVDLTTGLTFNIGTCMSRMAAQQTRLTRRFAWATLATVAPCMTSTWLVRLTIRFVLATCFVTHLVTFVACLKLSLFTRLVSLAAHLVTLVTHFVACLVLIRLAVVYFVHTVFSSVAVVMQSIPFLRQWHLRLSHVPRRQLHLLPCNTFHGAWFLAAILRVTQGCSVQLSIGMLYEPAYGSRSDAL